MDWDKFYKAQSDTSTLFWGAVIFLAVVVSCFFAWKAIDRLRNWSRFNGLEIEANDIKDPRFAGSMADILQWDARTGMTQHASDESLLIYGTRKQRKAIKERRARERAQKRKAPN
jgi:hypothetical protein